MINENDITTLGMKVSSYMSSSRYAHTLGVVSAAERIGLIFMPERVNELKAAAFLHDVAKELSYTDQLTLIDKFNVRVDREDLNIRPAVHSFAGVAVIKRDFPKFATSDVLSAVYNHTLGDACMSLFDEIIFLSDYIEDGRKYESCISVREQIYASISNESSYDDNVLALHCAVVSSCDATLKKLLSINALISSKTLKTKKAFLEKVEKKLV